MNNPTQNIASGLTRTAHSGHALFARLLFVALLFAGLTRPMQAAGVSFTSIPTSVGSGEEYYVEAMGWASGQCTLSIYKNNVWLCSGTDTDYAYAWENTTDYGEQTVQYFAEIVQGSYEDYAYTYAWVTITP